LGGGDGGALPCRVERGWGKKMAKAGGGWELKRFISGWRGEREGLLVSHGATWRVGASLGGAVGGGSALMAGACW
jgi:hypothetical protein